MKVGRVNFIFFIIFVFMTIGLLVATFFINNAAISLAFVITSVASFCLAYHYINAIEIDKLKARINVLEKIYD